MGKSNPSTPTSQKPKSGSPFCIRFTKKERAKLEHAAANLHLSTYIRSILFNRELPPAPSRRQNPIKDHKELAKLLALLGQSRIASNIHQLAKAANSGSLPVNVDVLQSLEDAVQAIRMMRSMLMKALGLQPRGKDDDT